MGVFPMAEHKDDPEIFWVDPKHRGILPLNRFHISRSLAKQLRRKDYDVSLNQDFEGVLDGCADRDDTWISDTIRRLYIGLHKRNQAHSLEVWREGTLIGGVYGVSLGAAFFGESMFSRATGGSKIALAYLTTHLRGCGYRLFDTQFITDHLASLGAQEIPRARYQTMLKDAIHRHADISGHQLPDVSSVLASSAAAAST